MDNQHPRLIALLGQPVGHSLSPLMHNAAFEVQNINLRYVTHEVAGSVLEEALSGMHALGYEGANITIPHKEAVRSFLAAESKQARAVGAVNTLIRKEDGWRGDNTDVAGFLQPLKKHASQVDGSSMLVFGAGGAARAVVYGLLKEFHPETITLAVRAPERAEPLIHDMETYGGGGALEVINIREAESVIQDSKLVVNATPVGMHPNDDETPWKRADVFNDHHIVYDLVYHPTETKLLHQAGLEGATCINGLAMLIAQAAVAYRLWTGRDMPLDVVRQRLSAILN